MSLTARLAAFPKANPFAFNLFVATGKTSAADLLTQTVVERKGPGDIDWKRNASFAVFGFGYLGAFQYWLQVNMFRRWFAGVDTFANQSVREKLANRAGMVTAGKQIAFDVLVHLPFMYFPTFYVVKEAVQGPEGTNAVIDGLRHWVENFSVDQVKMISVWGPADFVIFSVPMWLRLPTRHVVSFGWTAYVSFLRGASPSDPVDPKTGLKRKPTPM